MKTFGEKVVAFNKNLEFTGKLPAGFRVLNPFMENPETIEIMTQFYRKYYNDTNQRRFLIGINPGRLGAGTTGVPFTDTKRLKEFCDIEMKSAATNEVSAMFIYDMITDFGGPQKFYKEFYINSIFPLAIVRQKNKKWLNANYYDDPELFLSVKKYIIQSLKENIRLGLDTSEVFSLGKKNADFLHKINKEEKLFQKITVLEHPRYIQQYKTKDKNLYIEKYLKAFGKKA